MERQHHHFPSEFAPVLSLTELHLYPSTSQGFFWKPLKPQNPAWNIWNLGLSNCTNKPDSWEIHQNDSRSKFVAWHWQKYMWFSRIFLHGFVIISLSLSINYTNTWIFQICKNSAFWWVLLGEKWKGTSFTHLEDPGIYIYIWHSFWHRFSGVPPPLAKKRQLREEMVITDSWMHFLAPCLSSELGPVVVEQKLLRSHPFVTCFNLPWMVIFRHFILMETRLNQEGFNPHFSWPCLQHEIN